MKVSELKELLRDIPDDSNVVCYDRENGFYIDGVEVKRGFIRVDHHEDMSFVDGYFSEDREFLELTPDQQHKFGIKEYTILPAIKIS